jgi:tRNA(fMet)-specific endonuclease VapC
LKLDANRSIRMNGRHLLDTNIVIALFASDPDVMDFLNDAEEVFIPSIVIGELYYGAHKSSRAKENVARIDDFAASNVILSCDAETARWYGEAKDKLRQRGRPIPENDLWIAAIALQYDGSLVVRMTPPTSGGMV